MNIKGGTRGALKGNLKRRLDSLTLATIAFGEPGDGEVIVSPIIRGLSKVLDVWVGVGAVVIGDDGSTVPLAAADWPANAGNLQITPRSNFDDRPPTLFRPVFQDPTAAVNENHPLPQDLPFSWNFPGEADEAVLDVTLDKGAWLGFGSGGIQIQLQVMIEYFGPWWDIEAIELAMGQVQLTPCAPVRIFSS